jgi:hypothetical protein
MIATPYWTIQSHTPNAVGTIDDRDHPPSSYPPILDLQFDVPVPDAMTRRDVTSDIVIPVPTFVYPSARPLTSGFTTT